MRSQWTKDAIDDLAVAVSSFFSYSSRCSSLFMRPFSANRLVSSSPRQFPQGARISRHCQPIQLGLQTAPVQFGHHFLASGYSRVATTSAITTLRHKTRSWAIQGKFVKDFPPRHKDRNCCRATSPLPEWRSQTCRATARGVSRKVTQGAWLYNKAAHALAVLREAIPNSGQQVQADNVSKGIRDW